MKALSNSQILTGDVSTIITDPSSLTDLKDGRFRSRLRPMKALYTPSMPTLPRMTREHA